MEHSSRSVINYYPQALTHYSHGTRVADALLLDDGSFIPEFTALVASENIRLLQLKRADYFVADGDHRGSIGPATSLSKSASLSQYDYITVHVCMYVCKHTT